MLDILRRYKNKHAKKVSEKIMREKEFYREMKDVDSIQLAKTVYMEMILRSGNTDAAEINELLFLIKHDQFNEQSFFDYCKSVFWNYDELSDSLIKQLLVEANDIMSAI